VYRADTDGLRGVALWVSPTAGAYPVAACELG